MKIPALSMASPLAGRLLREGATLLNDVPCEAVVHIEQAYLGHHGPDQNYRPYLRLAGEMRGLVPQERLPGDVHELSARPTLGPAFDVFYEFTDEQLGQMVSKGYFSRQFNVPPIMTNADYELPVVASVLILEPEDRSAGDVPLVFVEVHNRNDLVLDLESSGYDLAEYFESVRQSEHSADSYEDDYESRLADPNDPRYVDDIFNDPRFAGLREAEAAKMAELDAQHERSERERGEIAAEQQTDADEFEDESYEGEVDDFDPDAPENMSLDRLYEQVVKPYVETKATDAVVPEQVAAKTAQVEQEVFGDEVEPDAQFDEGELSFEGLDEDEIGPEPISTGDVEAPSPQSSVQRAMARVEEEDEAAQHAAEAREIGD